jgi:homoserine O-acetyltransferase
LSVSNIIHFNESLHLESGRILDSFSIAYQSYGKMNEDKSNIILVCHALSGSQFVVSNEKKDIIGWWDGLVGENKTIDINKNFVICINALGSCFGSSSPTSINKQEKEEYRLNFPVITIKDMVYASKKCLDKLNIANVKTIIGPSMGGMQALQFAIDYPSFAKNIICIASTHKTGDYTIAFNKVNSEAIIKDPAFQNGNYNKKDMKKNGFGLAIARMVGHISFLSRNSMKDKFKNKYVSDDGLYDLFGRFQVDRYLEYNGYNFFNKFDPLSYLYLLKSINIFDISRGFDSLQDALSSIKSNLYLMSFSTDFVFDKEELKIISDTISKYKIPVNCEFVEIDSDYGHDAFLVEVERIQNYISKWIK